MCKRVISFVSRNHINGGPKWIQREDTNWNSNTIYFLESIQNAINGSINSIGMFFNLIKAHSVTNHEILLTELNVNGITVKLTYSSIPNYYSKIHLSNPESVYRTNIFLLAETWKIECHKIQFLGQIYFYFKKMVLKRQR